MLRKKDLTEKERRFYKRVVASGRHFVEDDLGIEENKYYKQLTGDDHLKKSKYDFILRIKFKETTYNEIELKINHKSIYSLNELYGEYNDRVKEIGTAIIENA